MPSPDPPPTSLASDLRRLNWPRTADDLNDLIAQATQRRWSPTVLLERVVAAELEDRQRRSVERRLSAARLGRFKPMADWDWDWPTALDRRALERVLALDFLALPDNVLLVGAQGLGKTMLAKNIVHAAVLAGHTARFHDRLGPPPRSQRARNRAGPRPPLAALYPAHIARHR